jgi:AAA family ATP:ADP antiporter
VQLLTVLSQVLITGRVAQRLGVVALLTVIPLAMVGGFLALAASGTFLVLATVMVLRRFGEYAFIRPAREMLWGRLSIEVKYKAKSFIDVPVYRIADAVMARWQDTLRLGGMSAAEGALLGVGVAVLWTANGWWLGRRFDRGQSL